ncbi:Uma2 family endonuclease [uncultured Thiohalocapsa sp.]|uniref:Uma2 family endonuclease n=1 Tax=uncultured Thiohalocapsa sp. TaxID=768990 RepID=UPI0025D0F67C|nr:Uma2 family endonuclease [uncultured Thiohalocapsa sp.]
MEAVKLKTLEDLLLAPEEDVELIGGEIVRRPMTRASHAAVQGNARGELHAFTHGSGPGGWWILTEVSVAYEPHECPRHDLAGWRRERLPHLPDGIIDLPPDWVCEIVSPGHEKKDTLTLPLLLRRHRVPFYWLIWPEDRVLIAHRLEGEEWRVIATLKDTASGRVPPFEAMALNLGDILGGE